MDVAELEETARLARLNTGRDELAAALPAFEQMLEFFAAMQEADAHTGERAGIRPVGADHFRDDSSVPDADTPPGEQLLDNAGERDGRFIVIPNVL